MSNKYADRLDNMKVSEIRQLLALTQDPSIISFAGGLPAPELFPLKDYKEAVCDVLDNDGQRALQYGPTEGFVPLREEIVKRMEKVQVNTNIDEILITSGSQQGLDFAAKIFINPGDIIISESPTYLGALNAFNAYQPAYIEIETDDDGMIMEELETVLKENKNAKFIYAIPDFQNPTGKTWSVERRKKLVELANKYDITIIEDNPYGELRFEGERLPAIKHYDTEGRVAFLGTFSKIFAPGLRLGWVCAAPELLQKFSLSKQASDLQASTTAQIELAKFLEMFDIEEHIEKIKKVYSERKNLMIEEMKKEFPPEIKYTNPQGGLFLWVELPENLDSKEIAEKALAKKVAYVPGQAFYPSGSKKNALRMNYSNMPEDRIIEGIKRLGEVFREAIEESK